MAFYISFSYPDGHVEEIDESFASLQAAIKYGDSLLNQVAATESTKKQGVSSNDIGAFFLVEEVSYDSRKLVFDSRKQ